MIIWGWRSLTGVLANGEFYCPQCAARRPYRHEKVRRWFTLYFIPVIPMDNLGEQITCSHCRNSFLTRVLNNDPEKLKADQLDRIARDWLTLMAGVATLCGGVTSEAAQAIVSDIQTATNRSFPPERVSEAAAAVLNPDGSATLRFGSLPDDLSTPGQERFLLGALNVLRMLTNCTPNDLKLMHMLADGLGVSASHVKGIMLEAGVPAV
jgi:hypothetical protein